jgi:hypothetical protein
MVSEEFRSQDLTMLHNVYNSQKSPITPTKYGFRGVAYAQCHRRTDRLMETITMSSGAEDK